MITVITNISFVLVAAEKIMVRVRKGEIMFLNTYCVSSCRISFADRIRYIILEVVKCTV